jgi:regulator of protease activity HflC (stomatin/prohibitin superfamily)
MNDFRKDAMKRFLIPLLSLALAAAALAGCTPHTTEATEIGVKFNKLTGSSELMEPGATHFFTPLLNDWQTFDTSVRSLVMTAQTASGDRQEKDDLRFKTRDGNDIETDVTVRWRIDPTQVGKIWQKVAPDTDAVQERLVRPLARTYVRDVLNQLNSEDFYNPRLRFGAANEATLKLGAILRPYGVVVEQVLLGNFLFKDEYQKLINSRKEAEKTAEKLEAEILATQEKNQATLQSKVAELTETLTRTEGELEQAKRAADAYLVQHEQDAQATLAEKTALAEGIRKERAALNSSAGDAYVNLQLIDALREKDIRQIPRLPNGNIIIDGNKLLDQLGVIRYEANRAVEPPPQ